MSKASKLIGESVHFDELKRSPKLPEQTPGEEAVNNKGDKVKNSIALSKRAVAYMNSKNELEIQGYDDIDDEYNRVTLDGESVEYLRKFLK